MKFLPFKQIARKTIDLFRVDEARIAEILESVRSQLPTTEALLIGKPQAGKSSIVRGLTGVGEEIVGQGFRPHTQHTQRYAYPSDELPLLIFTDTVGLGDVAQHTEEIIAELTVDTVVADGFQAIMTKVGDVICELRNHSAVKGKKIFGVGMAVAGLINKRKNLVTISQTQNLFLMI